MNDQLRVAPIQAGCRQRRKVILAAGINSTPLAAYFFSDIDTVKLADSRIYIYIAAFGYQNKRRYIGRAVCVDRPGTTGICAVDHITADVDIAGNIECQVIAGTDLTVGRRRTQGVV